MKKNLAILASFVVGISTTSTVLACGSIYSSTKTSTKDFLSISGIELTPPTEEEKLYKWEERIVEKINEVLEIYWITRTDLECVLKPGEIIVNGKNSSGLEGTIVIPNKIKSSRRLGTALNVNSFGSKGWNELIEWWVYLHNYTFAKGGGFVFSYELDYVIEDNRFGPESEPCRKIIFTGKEGTGIRGSLDIFLNTDDAIPD